MQSEKHDKSIKQADSLAMAGLIILATLWNAILFLTWITTAAFDSDHSNAGGYLFAVTCAISLYILFMKKSIGIKFVTQLTVIIISYMMVLMLDM